MTSVSYCIDDGYTTGLIGSVALLHANTYHQISGFGQEFEAKVASELAEFTSRLSHPKNNIWHVTNNDRIVASISIDGQDLGNNIAHLRWFIVDSTLRGSGLGRKLLTIAVQFCDDHDFSQIDLWTFKGLDAARKLYEQCGFELASEQPGTQWGSEVIEQKFIRKQRSADNQEQPQ